MPLFYRRFRRTAAFLLRFVTDGDACSSPGRIARIRGSPHAGGTPATYDGAMKYFTSTTHLPDPSRVFLGAFLLACGLVAPAYANQDSGPPVYPHSVQTKSEREASGFVARLYESHDAPGVVDAWYRGRLPACHRGSFSNGLIKYACPHGFIDVEPHSGGTIIEIVSN
jgi:hypothetical protein